VTFSGQSDTANHALSGAIAAAFDWWREAGVDFDHTDEARDWLAARAPAVTALPEPAAVREAPTRPPAPVAELPKIGGDPATWPQNLGEFAAWWLTEPSLDFGQVADRIAPRGPAGAEILIMVDHPEAEDSQSLLSGPQGRLALSILAAIGIAPEQAYFAALLPRHMPLPDWQALTAAGLGELARHHIALAAPRRVIGFGPHVSSLLGHDPAKSAEPFQQFYHVGPSIPALAAPGLSSLIARPKGKAGLWRNLLEWQGS